MNERCPLSFTHNFPGNDVPEVCRAQCGERFIQEGFGIVDIYDSVVDEVVSERCGERHGIDMEHSHDGLQVREGAERAYSVVDICRECDGEYMETVFTFNCPYHEA